VRTRVEARTKSAGRKVMAVPSALQVLISTSVITVADDDKSSRVESSESLGIEGLCRWRHDEQRPIIARAKRECTLAQPPRHPFGTPFDWSAALVQATLSTTIDSHSCRHGEGMASKYTPEPFKPTVLPAYGLPFLIGTLIRFLRLRDQEGRITANYSTAFVPVFCRPATGPYLVSEPLANMLTPKRPQS
jgi:hypothetical protein